MIHIPDKVYEALNRQIDEFIGRMERETETETFTAGYLEYEVAITCLITMSVTRMRFRDEAWGFFHTFTETAYHCEVEVVDYNVTDEEGDEVESDFDENSIAGEYDGCDWK